MRIISQGRKPGDKEYRATCHNCDTMIEFRQNEAAYVADPRDGDYLAIPCPTCSEAITVTP